MSHPSSGERLQRSLRRLALATAGATLGTGLLIVWSGYAVLTSQPVARMRVGTHSSTGVPSPFLRTRGPGAEGPACHCAPERATLTTQRADRVQLAAARNPDPTSH